jgi:putative glutamate/gamma-aminobutyrate antiporter
MTSKPKTLNVYLLTMINLATILSIRNWPLTAQYGFSSIFFIIMACTILLIPTSLVAAELATGWPERGGIYVWVREALGKKFAFLAVFLLWIENVVWYPMILSFVASTLSFVFNKDLAENALYTYLVVLIVFWLSTLINSKGMKLSGWISSIGVNLGTLLPGTIIILIGVFWYFSGRPLEIEMNFDHFFPKFNSLSEFTFLAGIMLGFAGMEMSSVHANDVENPQKNYPKAILYSSLIIIIFSTLGSLTIAMIIPENQISLTSGGIAVVYKVFSMFNLAQFVPVIALLVTIGALGSVSTWIAGPCRGLIAAAQEGDLPPFFRKLNKHEMPIRLMVCQGFIVTILATIILIAPSVSSSFWMLIALTSQLYLLMYMLMFIAGIVLRYKRPEKFRAYRVPFKNIGMWIVGSIGLLGSLFGFLIGFIPPTLMEGTSVALYEGFLISGCVLFTFLPFAILRWQKKQEKSLK